VLAIEGTEGTGVGRSEKQFATTSRLQISSNSSSQRVCCAHSCRMGSILTARHYHEIVRMRVCRIRGRDQLLAGGLYSDTSANEDNSFRNRIR